MIIDLLNEPNLLSLTGQPYVRFRKQYIKDANLAYNRRMLMAHAGKSEYPSIRTFGKLDTSTNSVFRDLEAAEKL